MLQFLVIEYLYASTRVVQVYDFISFGTQLLVTIIYTFVFANVVFVVFEGPLMAILKHYSDYKRRTGLVEPIANGDSVASKKVD